MNKIPEVSRVANVSLKSDVRAALHKLSVLITHGSLLALKLNDPTSLAFLGHLVWRTAVRITIMNYCLKRTSLTVASSEIESRAPLLSSHLST